MKAAALVGMPGSGKSEVARIFVAAGYRAVRFGDITDEEVRNRQLELNEGNERVVREELRKLHGMAAYAVLNLPKIRAVLEASPVVIDGLYSWEEYTYLREQLKSGLKTVAVWAPPELRYSRLISRQVRPLTMEQARARDYAEIENVNKGGPIAMADYTIKNDTTLAELKEQVLSVIRDLR